MNVAFSVALTLRPRPEVGGAKRACICATASKESKKETNSAAKVATPVAKPEISQRMRFREEIEAPCK